MSAKYQVEEFFAAQLALLLPELGVPVVPGSSGGHRPKDFVTVNCPDEEARGSRGWEVDTRIVSVAQLDDDEGLQASMARLLLLSQFFSSADCPLRRATQPGLYIAGIQVLRTTRLQKPASRGEILPLLVLATVAG